MKNVNVRKLALAGILVAVGIVCSPLSIPVGASKCAPVQHFINILGGVFLGPGYAVGMAFVTSLLRNLMGTGTLLAFPGSMCGAFLCGMLYKYGKHLPFAYAGELVGTSVIGGLLSYPIFVVIVGYIILHFSWTEDIAPVMWNRVPGQSFMNPYEGRLSRQSLLRR